MKNFLTRRLLPFLVQLVVVFSLLVALDTYFPKEILAGVVFGFYGLLFLNVVFDKLLSKFYNLEPYKGSGRSKIRNQKIAQNYFAVAILFGLSGIGAFFGSTPIAPVILVGIPLALTWGLLLKYGI